MQISDFVSRLNHVQQRGDEYSAQCPAHDDRKNSLCVREGEKGIILTCQAGCDTERVLDTMGLSFSDLFAQPGKMNGGNAKEIVECYDYRGVDGNLQFQVVRMVPKNFRQRRPDGAGHWVWGLSEGEYVQGGNGDWYKAEPDDTGPRKRFPAVACLLFNLPAIAAASESGKRIYVVEGEKDVRTLASHGLIATCNPGGAGKWRSEYSESLRGVEVVIVPDNDEPGRKHANKVARALFGVAASVKIVELPNLPIKGDVTDYFGAGGTAEQLESLVTASQPHGHVEHESAELALTAPPEGPLPLRRRLPEAIPFPWEALGEVLGAAARRIHEIVQAPDGVCGQSILAAACLAVQGHANLEIDGRVLPLSEYFISISPSGGRKSATDNLALAPHRAFERELAKKLEAEWKQYRVKKDAYEAAYRDRLKKAGGSEDKEQALAGLGDSPVEPIRPGIIWEEPTYEGLVKQLRDGWPSAGLFSDEGARLFGGHAMNAENQLKTLAGLSSLWDGRAITRSRSGEDSTILYERRMTGHWMVQPVVAEMILGNRTMADQGFLSRILICHPASTIGHRTYQEVDLCNDEAILRYHDRILEILRMKLPLAPNSRNELAPRPLRLARDAKELWMTFHDLIEEQQRDEQPLAHITGFASKAAEHAARLAGVLSLIRDTHRIEVCIEDMAAGIELAQYYLNEMLRLADAGMAAPDLILAEKLLAWAQARGEDVTLVEVYQFGPKAVRDKATAERIAGILESHGWFVQVPGGLVRGGKRHRQAWKVVRS